MRSLLNMAEAFFQGRSPGQLVIQITSHCNASCPQCGMRASSRQPRNRLSLDTVKKIIDHAACRGVQAISFTGGEPLLFFEDLLEMIRHAGKAGIPYIRTGTNGFFLAQAMQGGEKERACVTGMIEKLAATPLRNFWISMDSFIPEVHEEMRGIGHVVRGIEWAMPIFERYGLYPSANLGITRALAGNDTAALNENDFENAGAYFDEFLTRFHTAFARFYSFARDLGFTIANCCYPMSVASDEENDLAPVYSATAEDRLVCFSPAEKKVLFTALAETIPAFRHTMRIFTPLVSLYSLIGQYSGGARMPYACRGGRDFFFVDASKAHVFPCGYRGWEDFGPLERADIPRTGGRECRECDWECFRDPSEMLGPLLQLFKDPPGLIRKWIKDPAYFKILFSDLDYYRACDFFDGRKTAKDSRLQRFRPRVSKVIRHQREDEGCLRDLRSASLELAAKS